MTAQLDQIENRLERLLTAVERIAETTERQSQTAERQQQSIHQFVGILAEQARAITELTQSVREAVLASQRAA